MAYARYAWSVLIQERLHRNSSAFTDVLADERARGLNRERRSGLPQPEQRLFLAEIDS